MKKLLELCDAPTARCHQYALSACGQLETFEKEECDMRSNTSTSNMQQTAETFSPVLFLTTTGEPMRFFLRPGPAKVELQPLIAAGGGLVSRAQQPGVILLADPEEVGSHQENTAHWYVSTHYIRDCVQRNQQLEVEDYRLGAETLPRRSARRTNCPSLAEGRLAYTPEDDQAILSHVAQHLTLIRGNRLWQQMARDNVTSHSWQSMKYRYSKKLSHRLEGREEEQTEEKGREEGREEEGDNQESPSSSEEHVASPDDGAAPDVQTHQPAPPCSAGDPDPAPPCCAEDPEPVQGSGVPAPERGLAPAPEEVPVSAPEGVPAEGPVSSWLAARSTLLLEESLPTQTCRKRPRPAPTAGQRTASPAGPASALGVSEGGAVTQEVPKRKLGILETASREFEDDSVSEQEGPDLTPPSLPDDPAANQKAKPHLFLFERDSQERSQAPPPTAPQPIRSQEVGCLTQGVQDDIQRIRLLMEQTNQDLVSVTKALLRTSGDFSEALLLLSTSSSALRVFWSAPDDSSLLLGEPAARQRLLQAHGEKAVARRLFFLQAE